MLPVCVVGTPGGVQLFPYKYIALDDGEPLKWHEEMQLSYILKRPKYEIAADVDRKNVWNTPTADERVLVLRVEDEHGEILGEEQLPF